MTERSTDARREGPAPIGTARAATARRAAAGLAALAVAVVLLVACWFRVSSLGGFPVHGADESYYGIQSWRLAHGESFRLRTVTGNVIDPFLVLAQAPFYRFVEPAAWIPRLPVAASGIAAAALLFVLFRRILDGPTALTAAVLLATMPPSIAFARYGCEFGQTPLAGVIAASFAFRGRVGWLAASVAAALLVHPTNIFLVPILGPVALVRVLGGTRSDPRRVREARRSLLGLLAAAAAASALLWLRPEVRGMIVARLGGLALADAATAADGLRFLFTLDPPGGGPPGATALALGAGAAAALLAGLAGQARRRQWDRLALAAGFALGAVGLHLLGGPDVLLGSVRYGAVLLTPAALVVGGAMRGILPRVPEGEPRAFGAPGLALAALAGAALLAATERNVFRPALRDLGESIWTFRSEAADPYAELIAQIRADRGRRDGPGAARSLVLAQDYFVAMPLTFLLAEETDLGVVQLLSISQLGEYVLGGDPMAPRLPRLAERLASGDYAIRGPSAAEPASRFLEDLIVGTFPADRVRRWAASSNPELRLYRVEPPTPAVALGTGDAPATTAR